MNSKDLNGINDAFRKVLTEARFSSVGSIMNPNISQRVEMGDSPEKGEEHQRLVNLMRKEFMSIKPGHDHTEGPESAMPIGKFIEMGTKLLKDLGKEVPTDPDEFVTQVGEDILRISGLEINDELGLVVRDPQGRALLGYKHPRNKEEEGEGMMY